MSDPRIIKVELDEATILRRNADIEQERRVAIFDLIEENFFKPLRDMGDGYAGPYHLSISVTEGRLILDIRREDGSPHETLILGLGRFRRPLKDYFAICDSYYQAIRKAMATADVISKLQSQGIDVVVSSPDQMRQRGLEDLKRWGDIIRTAGIKVD